MISLADQVSSPSTSASVYSGMPRFSVTTVRFSTLLVGDGTESARYRKRNANMTKNIVVLLVAVFMSLNCIALYAQETATTSTVDQEIQLMRKDLQSDKKLIVAANMVLTDAEARKFWPVYDQYVADLAKVNDTKLTLIKEYAASIDNLSDAKAEDLVRRWTDADDAAIQLRMKYVPLLQKVLPGTKAARFFQIDRRIGLIVDLQLASQIPLVTQ